MERLRSFLSSTTRLVLTIGALAGAVAAVIALVPKPAETQEASFSDVTAEPAVSLEHYDAELGGRGVRSLHGSRPLASIRASALRLAADTAAAPELADAVGEGPVAEGEGESSSTSSSTSVETSDESAQTTGESTSTSASTSITVTSATASSESSTVTASTIPPPAPSSVSAIAGAKVAEGTGAREARRHAVVKKLEHVSLPPAKGCLSPCETRWVVGRHDPPNGLNAMIDHELLYYDPVKAAQALAVRFASCRLKVDGHRQSPLGAMVTYDLTLDGFAGEWLTVAWSLESTRSAQEVPRCWWQEVSAEQIKPTVNHRSFSGRFWVPMPSERGDYRIRLVLTDREGRTEYVSKSSEPTIH